MADEDPEVPEDVEEYAKGEMGPPQQQSINKSEFRRECRHLIDIAAQSGISPDEVQGALEDLSTGVPYFYEDIRRYARSPDGDEQPE